MSLIRILCFLLPSQGFSRFLSTYPSFTLESYDFMEMFQSSSIATTRTVHDTTTSLASREPITTSTFELLGTDPKETFDEPPFGKELSDLSADVELIISHFQQEKFVGTQNESNMNGHYNGTRMHIVLNLYLIFICFQ